MPQCCAVPNCSNKKGGHKFPRDKSRLEQWLIAIRRERYTPSIHSVVCKDHFNKDDYELPKDSVIDNPRPVLKKDSVPSIFSWNKAMDNMQTQRRSHRNIKIKIEKESDITSQMASAYSTQRRCYTCLQHDRNLRPMKDHAKWLFAILCPELFCDTQGAVYLVCWECESMGDKIRRFQDKLKKVSHTLQLSLKGKATIIEGLSSHTITKIEIISIPPQNPKKLPQKLQKQPQKPPKLAQKLPTPPQLIPITQQKLPIPQQKLPIPQQKLPIPQQKLPISQQKLPIPSQKLPIPTQKQPMPSQNPPFIISPENIMKLSLKDMLEEPSKVQSQTKIKKEPNFEENPSYSNNDFMDEGSCSNDYEEPIQPSTVIPVSCDPLLVPRQNQPISWAEIEVPPFQPKPIKHEVITPMSTQDELLQEKIPLRGSNETFKVSDKAQNSTAKDSAKLVTSEVRTLKCELKNDFLTKLLAKPSRGEELLLKKQWDHRPPEGSQQKSEPESSQQNLGDEKVIILNRKELEEARDKRRSLNSYVISQYKCEKCLEYFGSQQKMDEHNLKHDESRGKSVCEICEQRFPNETELSDHFKAHFIMYECSKCPYRNRSRVMLSIHCRTKHEESTFYCKTCFQKFKTFKERRIHIDREHDQKQACKECKKTFPNAAQLKQHVLKIHRSQPVECPICKKDVKPYYLKYHIKTHSERGDNFYCADCGTFYKTKLTYEYHLKTTLKHNSLEKLGFKCDHCDKYFASKLTLKTHIDAIGGFKYTCDICNKECKSKKTLSKHIAIVHQKIKRKFKPKICEVCGKSFTVRKSLVEHLNSHLGVRPHVCEDCGATFVYSAALFTHRKLVHKVKRKSDTTE